MANRRFVLDKHLAKEAKSIVVLAVRNGPIENIHAGIECPTCAGKEEYSHISNEEMKRVMKNAVNKVYEILWLKRHAPKKYRGLVEFGNRYARSWDDPEWKPNN